MPSGYWQDPDEYDDNEYDDPEEEWYDEHEMHSEIMEEMEEQTELMRSEVPGQMSFDDDPDDDDGDYDDVYLPPMRRSPDSGEIDDEDFDFAGAENEFDMPSKGFLFNGMPDPDYGDMEFDVDEIDDDELPAPSLSQRLGIDLFNASADEDGGDDYDEISAADPESLDNVEEFDPPDSELQDEANESTIEHHETEEAKDDDQSWGNDLPDEDGGETGPINQL